MIKEQEACQCEMWFDGKGGIRVGNRCYLKEVFAESHRTLLLCLGLYCAPEEVPGCGAFLKKSSLFKVYGRTMYISTLNLRFASFVA